MLSWPVVARLLAAVPPAHSGIVPQEPALHATLAEALGSHEPLCSQVPLLAKGWQLLAC